MTKMGGADLFTRSIAGETPSGLEDLAAINMAKRLPVRIRGGQAEPALGCQSGLLRGSVPDPLVKAR